MSNGSKKEGIMNKDRIVWIAAIEFAVILVLGFALWRDVQPDEMNIDITDPSGKAAVKLGIKAQKVDYEKMLEAIFKEPRTLVTLGVVEWLRVTQKMYLLADERLAGALATDLCAPIPEKPIEDHIKKGAGVR